MHRHNNEPIREIVSDWSSDKLDEVVRQLPQLPPVLRYYDRFEEKIRSIPSPATENQFKVYVNGEEVVLDFSTFKNNHGYFLKCVFAFILKKDLNIHTATHYLFQSSHLPYEDLSLFLASSPTTVADVWRVFRGRELPASVYYLLKTILKLLCEYKINGYSELYGEYLSSSLPFPEYDKYAAVRSGDVFLTVDHEAKIVRQLDAAANKLAKSPDKSISYQELCDLAMLLCAYQFGMRPIQIAMLRRRDMRIIEEESKGVDTIHLTFQMVKQRRLSVAKPLTRAVKRDWVPIFKELARQKDCMNLSGDERLCGTKSASETARRIANFLEKLLGTRFSARDLRHTAAQRLVDAGASQHELAEFMGHTDITTGLVYFETSASQAERVNKALGISTIYKRVAKIAHDRFISKSELDELKQEQQIAGVPHGIAIAGIGGCSSGQPACPSNPVLACYGCNKFMPIHDSEIHERVLGDFRDIVRFFFDSSRDESNSPAYLQLQRTIAEVQLVLSEISERDT